MTLTTDKANQTFLLQYVKDYCDAITENYKRDSIHSYERMLEKDSEDTYAADRLNAIQNGTANLTKFDFTEGKKYYKIIQKEFRNGEYVSSSVHSFVGKSKDVLGNVYKPASWSAPHTKHVRFSFCDPTDFKNLLDPNFVGWAGGYLYMR